MSKVKTVGAVVEVSPKAIVIDVTHSAYASWSRSVDVVARKRFRDAWVANRAMGLGSQMRMSVDYGHAQDGDVCVSRYTFEFIGE